MENIRTVRLSTTRMFETWSAQFYCMSLTQDESSNGVNINDITLSDSDLQMLKDLITYLDLRHTASEYGISGNVLNKLVDFCKTQKRTSSISGSEMLQIYAVLRTMLKNKNLKSKQLEYFKKIEEEYFRLKQLLGEPNES